MKRILFIVGLTFCASGCVSLEYNLATGKQEISFYSTEKEVKIGKSLARALEQREKLLADAPLQERVDDIGRRIAEVCDRKDLTYHFAVLEKEGLNAFALPGGYVYLNSELAKTVPSDDEIACVIAHEIAHVTARHNIKRLQAYWGATFLLLVSSYDGTSEKSRISEALHALMSDYAREEEMLADRLAVRYADRAGYDGTAMLTLLNRLRERQRQAPLKPKIKYHSHPYLGDRIRAVKEELEEPLDFLDYVNSTADFD